MYTTSENPTRNQKTPTKEQTIKEQKHLNPMTDLILKHSLENNKLLIVTTRNSNRAYVYFKSSWKKNTKWKSEYQA